jgi:ribosomal protein S18 acetylase RimI-like enzyme
MTDSRHEVSGARAPSPSSASVTVETVTEVTDELVDAIARLLPQLSSTASAPSAEELATVAASPGSTLFISRLNSGDHAIVGTLTLVVYRIPTGGRAVIEDVVVDEAARGFGAATALVAAAIETARDAGVRNVELTSRPSREAANRLYTRMGFEVRETNVYRFRQP